jgi:ubiquinone/menaquinone biosynthesis C-methylase UbiE
VSSALPYLDGPRVLEIGHGPGHLQVALQEKGLAAYGLDESRQMGSIAVSRLRRKGMPPRLARGYAQALPFESGRFDNVVATFPTEYIFDPQTLAAIWRVLRPGGKLVVVLAAWINGKGLPDRAAAWLFRVTGQGSPLPEAALERIRAPFAVAGFDVRSEALEKEASTVLVIIATKAE